MSYNILYPINTFKAFCPVLFVHPFKLHQTESIPTYDTSPVTTASLMATLAHIPFQHCIPSLSFAHQASMMQSSYSPRSSGLSWESSSGLTRRRTDTHLEQQHCMDPRPRASWYLPQLDVSSSSLEAPSPWVALHLGTLCAKQSSSLFTLVRDAHTQLVAGANIPFSQAAGHSSMLSNFHASIVELDDALSEPEGCSTDRLTLSACRSWLHQLQTFVMALHRDIATITSISTSDKEATAKLWGLFGHDASTLLQLVISAVPADLTQQQRQSEAAKQPCSSQSSCADEEEPVVKAVLHLSESCGTGCAVQDEATHGSPAATLLEATGKATALHARSGPMLSKPVNKVSVMGYHQHWAKKPTI